MKKLLQTKAIIENVEGKLMAVASEEIPDRDGDVISIDGWELKNFKKNPVMLFLHNLTDRALPIGRAESIGIKEINGKRKLVFSPVFEEITELGRTVSEFFKQGFMKAFSVGFLPLEAEKISAPDEWPPRFKFNKQELLEISAVPVPALPTATIIDQAKSLGLDMKIVDTLVKDMEGIKISNSGESEDEDEQEEEKLEHKGDEGEGEGKPTEGEKPDGGEPGSGDNGGESTVSNEDNNGDKAQEASELKGKKSPKDSMMGHIGDMQDLHDRMEGTMDKMDDEKAVSPEEMMRKQLKEMQSLHDKMKDTMGSMMDDDKQIEPNVVKVDEESIKKIEAMMKHLIGEVQANRKETKKTVTTPVLQEALGKFAEILPKAIEIANHKKQMLEGGGGKT